ncbi:MAG: hypothetical protein P8078_02475 [bacterium]
MAGINDNKPLVNVMLRVIVKLYVMFAKQNIAEELNPCANIIANLACIPIFVPDKAPANISAI